MDKEDENVVFLRDSLSLLDSKPYVTLSHCWGKEKPILFTQASKTRLREGIEIKELPKTFREAIKVLRKLGFRYLWIDSL